MRLEDWERAGEWFHRLAPLDVAERSERLEEVSASDPDLAGDVRSLLSAHDSEGLLSDAIARDSGFAEAYALKSAVASLSY